MRRKFGSVADGFKYKISNQVDREGELMDKNELYVAVAFSLLYLLLMIAVIGIVGAVVFIFYEVLHFGNFAVVFFLVIVLILAVEVYSLEKYKRAGKNEVAMDRRVR